MLLINKNNNYSTACLISQIGVYVYVYCFLIVHVAEGLGVASPQYLYVRKVLALRPQVQSLGFWSAVGLSWDVQCWCAAACLSVLKRSAGAGEFGVMVITGMAQP